MATIPGERGVGYNLLGRWVFFMGSIKGKTYAVAHLGLVVGCQVQTCKSTGSSAVKRQRTMFKIYIPERKLAFEVELGQREWVYCHPRCVPWHGNAKVGRRIAVLWDATYDNPAMRAQAKLRFPGLGDRAYYEAYVVEVHKPGTENKHAIYRLVYPIDGTIQIRRLMDSSSDWCFLDAGKCAVDGLAVISWTGDCEVELSPS